MQGPHTILTPFTTPTYIFCAIIVMYFSSMYFLISQDIIAVVLHSQC